MVYCSGGRRLPVGAHEPAVYSLSSFGPYSSSFDDTSLHQTSFYGSLLFNALDKRLNIEVGARTNDHSRYGHNSTYTFNPSFSITKNWRVFGSIATGFKAPSIFRCLMRSVVILI
ncbi:MAG: TonB-dependent receptor [Bacteroidota bacterium]